MNKINNWIWLSEKLYPDNQRTVCTSFADGTSEKRNYCVAEFKKEYEFDEDAESLNVKISADTFFRLYINGEFVGNGPACAGGDFENENSPYWHYANNYSLKNTGKKLSVFVQVQLSPVVMTDISCGRGGLAAQINAHFKSGREIELATDESWQCRINKAYTEPFCYDGRIMPPEWSNAEKTSFERHIKDAPIPMLSFEKIRPVNQKKIVVKPGETKEFTAEFDKIYSASADLQIETDGCEIDVTVGEYGDVISRREKIVVTENMHYTDMNFHSMGRYTLRIKNFGQKATSVLPAAVFQCYPTTDEGKFICSDKSLNKIYDVCKHTLKICRQTMHLDSPMHQEPLACTGDYYIESLMTAFTFGDMRLASFDVMRTADMLCENGGKMFHTTYSLIWVRMLWDVYMFTGDKNLLNYCKDAVRILLKRFETYLGENGVIDSPPNYMFVDWVVADGYSMHHPPKALGQTCLNAFYRDALCHAAKIMEEIGDGEMQEKYLHDAEKHKENHNKIFFDKEKRLYFDGLNGKTGSHKWLPENIDGRYYSKHSNILCVMSGLCEGELAKEIIERVINEKFITELQPYFMHFLFEALKKTGLYKKYALSLLYRWSVMTNACSKGLQEGWIKPEESYSFDHSHAWGGTPAYQLPYAVTGLEMLEPGYKKIALSPDLLGLDSAYVKIPTPKGYIVCDIKRDAEPKITVPESIEFNIN